ncbi:MAG: hypothetical protein WBG35_02890, partial [Acidobacteriaceae bacterium]
KKRMKKSASLPKFTNDQYLEFLRTVQLRGMGMEQGSFAIQRPLLGAAIKEGKQIQTGFATKYELQVDEPNQFVVMAVTEVKQRVTDSETDIASINCVFTALFECEPGAVTSLREQFAQNQAKIILWPFIRQFVTEASNHMSVAQILLPVVVLSE